MSNRAEVIFGWLLLIASIIGWPMSALVWAKDEPPFILGLSWLAITFTALGYLKTARVHRDQDNDE